MKKKTKKQVRKLVRDILREGPIFTEEWMLLIADNERRLNQLTRQVKELKEELRRLDNMAATTAKWQDRLLENSFVRIGPDVKNVEQWIAELALRLDFHEAGLEVSDPVPEFDTDEEDILI